MRWMVYLDTQLGDGFFFVEGGLTALVAIVALFVLPDFPETNTIPWLTLPEHALARRRMFEDADESFSGSESVSFAEAVKGFILATADWKVWYLAIALYFAILSVSFSIYFPTLAATMGYDAVTSLLLCVPPWVAAAVGALWISRHSDRSGERCVHVIIPIVVGIVGFLLAMSTMDVAVRYFSLFLMAQSNAGSICLLAWASAIISNPPAKRAVALALINAISQSSNIVGADFCGFNRDVPLAKEYFTGPEPELGRGAAPRRIRG
ncbi:hypothetical protein D9756_000666 [Leucocoprinus leucothites]|uniref:Uncharacterized protein n=1 Tax=Leucocoprinus leucothites TaxID=201217 RepID=A0A8H5GEY8_9AGAR|nr:hypothetical protein D9756_000666 [Leucoagaricus leucothites]